MNIPGPNLQRTMTIIRDRHGGRLCQCQGCQASMVASFANDLTAANSQTVPDLMQLLAFTAFRSWEFNAGGHIDLIREIARIANPNWQHMSIHVSVDPLTAEQQKLLETPPRGSA